MEEYIKELFNQFKLSTGIYSDDVDSKKYEKEFMEWLSRYKIIGELYFKWLKEEKILDELSPEFAEVGKGEHDTLTLNQKTTLISPYIKNLDCSSINNRILKYDFTVFDGIPICRRKKPRDIVDGIEVFMTQNPFDMVSMINWPQLYNYASYDIIVGLYGNIFDKDREYKLKNLKIMRERIKDSFKIKEVTSGDTYCYVLSTGFTKRKTKLHN